LKDEQQMKLVIFGPPGAGKGTLAQGLQSKLGIPHLDMGELLRDEVRRGTEVGKIVSAYISQGRLAPDEVVFQVLRQKLEQTKGYILDGFPRTPAQAEMLEKVSPPDLVLNLVVPEEVIIRRLSARRLCEKCGAIYNLISLPPAKEGICDRCGGRLYLREDDRPEIVKERLRVYREQTEPVLEFYRRKGILREVEGAESKEETLNRALQVLTSKRKSS
jgi:adenylate kinase